MQYEFKRSFYYEVEKAINTSNITFILGPRKCGKTICMLQLQSNLNNVVYTDMKVDYENDSQRIDFIKEVIKSILSNENIIYLIDEATYMILPDKEIGKIALAYNKCNNSNTKVVFSGSQSSALEFWGHIACGGFAAFIRADFLSYPEWLAFKGVEEVSEKTYLDFIMHTRDFYPFFSNTKDYLQGCLDETVMSNRKAIEYVVGDSSDNVTVEGLLDILYASIVKLHNHTTYNSFFNKNLLNSILEHYFDIKLTEDEIKRIEDVFSTRYESYQQMSSYDCKCAMQFLASCGLTTVTYTSDTLCVDSHINEKVLKVSNEIHTKPEVFSRFNLTINYPMFFVDLIQDVLSDRVLENLPKALLGSIVECHVRGLLPSVGSFEYRDTDNKEVDYVSVSKKAIEISVSNKSLKDVNFSLLPENYEKILLTKDITDTVGDIKRIPYYQFIYDNSPGKELLKKTHNNKQ